MTWPQGVMLILLTLRVVGHLMGALGATFPHKTIHPLNTLLAALTYSAGIAYVLHAGGFW